MDVWDPNNKIAENSQIKKPVRYPVSGFKAWSGIIGPGILTVFYFFLFFLVLSGCSYFKGGGQVGYNLKIIEGRDKYFYGDINYGLIDIGNNKLEYFKFKTDDGFIDYFNRKGENVKKSILKTPLDGAKLSSGFGMRTHPISGFNKMHKGVDFAAPTGTPVFAGGNGTIDFAGRNGGYGKYIRIRHNNEYKTAYAHLSNFKKGISKGVRVNQGDVIGFVGSTGNSTGPHLHYEIIFQNKQINPLKLKLPSGKKLKGNELKRYISEMKIIYANHLNLLFE